MARKQRQTHSHNAYEPKKKHTRNDAVADAKHTEHILTLFLLSDTRTPKKKREKEEEEEEETKKKRTETIKCFHNSSVQFLFISRTIQNSVFLLFFSFQHGTEKWFGYIVYICFGVTPVLPFETRTHTKKKNISTCYKKEYNTSNNRASNRSVMEQTKKW